MIGRGTPMGLSCMNAGRGYACEYVLNNSWLYEMINAATVFPEAHLNASPDLESAANWWMSMIPAGYESAHEQWGDCKFGGSSRMRLVTTGYDLACFTGSPSVSEYYKSLNELYGPDGHEVFGMNWFPPTIFQCPSRARIPPWPAAFPRRAGFLATPIRRFP